MTSSYNRIHRLRRSGLTWEALGLAIAKAHTGDKHRIARNTLRSLQNTPHYKPGKALSRAIQIVHDEYFPSPFPKGVNGLMSSCRTLMQDRENPAVADMLLSQIEAHVAEQLTTSKQPELIHCRLFWILGNINQNRMRQARLKKLSLSTVERYQSQAITHYHAAASINTLDSLPIEQYKLRHNIFVCYVNAVNERDRNNNPALIKQLETIPYLASVQQVLEHEPFQWECARNGLLYASITKDRESIATLFEALVSANQHFIELNYEPLGCDSIINDPSLRWALNNVLTPNYIQATIDKLERNKPLKNKHVQN